MMKKEITVGQLLSVAAALLIAVITGWITFQNKVVTAENKIQELQSRQSEDRIEYRKIIDELKWQIADGNQRITGILVELQNKANRR